MSDGWDSLSIRFPPGQVSAAAALEDRTAFAALGILVKSPRIPPEESLPIRPAELRCPTANFVPSIAAGRQRNLQSGRSPP